MCVVDLYVCCVLKCCVYYVVLLLCCAVVFAVCEEHVRAVVRLAAWWLVLIELLCVCGIIIILRCLFCAVVCFYVCFFVQYYVLCMMMLSFAFIIIYDTNIARRSLRPRVAFSQPFHDSLLVLFP